MKEELYLKRAAELDEITTKRNEMRALYDQLRKKRSTDFLCGKCIFMFTFITHVFSAWLGCLIFVRTFFPPGFNTITSKLKEMYQMITLGGDAELELVDSLDPFTEGIIFRLVSEFR